MDKQALDRYLTTEPDNGYWDWCEQVFDLISDDDIGENGYAENEKFFDDGLMELGSLQASINSLWSDGFISQSFAAGLLVRRFKRLKANPHLKTWEDVKKFSLAL